MYKQRPGRDGTCVGHYIGSGAAGIAQTQQEARIRNFGVGLVALATLAAAGLLLRGRRLVPIRLKRGRRREGMVDRLYAAGL